MRSQKKQSVGLQIGNATGQILVPIQKTNPIHGFSFRVAKGEATPTRSVCLCLTAGYRQRKEATPTTSETARFPNPQSPIPNPQ